MTSASISTGRGEMPLYVAGPTGPGPWSGVVVIHDALGMSCDIRRQADWLASEGFLAAAPDLFYWGKRASCLFALIRGWVPHSELDATRNWLAALPECTGRIGVIGFCMGGGFALALAADHDFSVASVNYGALTAAAETALPRACPIVGSFGDKDRWPGVRKAADRIEEIMIAANIDHDIKRYPNAGHGFMNDHAPSDLTISDKLIARVVAARYDEPCTRDARNRIVSFFRKHLAGDDVGPVGQ
jgi:carboxymethylenebutenolidase